MRMIPLQLLFNISLLQNFRKLTVSSETDFNFRHGALEAHSHLNFEYPIKLIRKSKYGFENFTNPPEAAT